MAGTLANRLEELQQAERSPAPTAFAARANMTEPGMYERAPPRP